MNSQGIAWNASHHVLGLDELDAAHRDFTVRLNALLAAADAEFPALFQQLVLHTREHFNTENRLMRESGYPGLGVHEGEHHRVLGELQQLNRSLKRGRLMLVRAYAREGLPEWFEIHLSTMDGALAAHLHKKRNHA